MTENNCPKHGATQGGLPCVWCWESGGRFVRPVPDPQGPVFDVNATMAIRTEMYHIERWRFGTNEYRYWMPA